LISSNFESRQTVDLISSNFESRQTVDLISSNFESRQTVDLISSNFACGKKLGFYLYFEKFRFFLSEFICLLSSFL